MELAGDRTLRAKYLDWCSARLAERFLDLTPEEIYERASSSPDEPGPSAGVSTVLPPPTNESYRDLVQRVTDSLLQESALPTYEQWADAYREKPSRFDAELLGFWKELVDSGDEAPRDPSGGA